MSDRNVQSTDVLPTVADLAGVRHVFPRDLGGGRGGVERKLTRPHLPSRFSTARLIVVTPVRSVGSGTG
ncbi:MAG TPA: hypothetical protein VFA26_02110 [Gemmataceae bacterium]|nr:hypothetical protein [Gemmataceae bacterium]